MHDQTKNNDDELNSNDLDEKDQPESDYFSNNKTSENIPALSETEKKVFSLLYSKKFQPATKIEKSSKAKHVILPKKLSPPANNDVDDQNSNPNVEKRKRRSKRTPHIEVRKKICLFHLRVSFELLISRDF